MMQLLTGVSHQPTRVENCVVATSAALPDAVGEIYVNHMLSEKDRTHAEKIVQTIVATFNTHLVRLPWMSPSAKKAALAKLGQLEMSVGKPDAWHKYPFALLPDAFFANGEAAQRYSVTRAFSRLKETVDRKRWPDATSVVAANVFYSRASNALFVPAGALQAPIFSSSYPSSRNFASLGSIVAAQLTLAVDNQGRYYDGEGKLVDWWNKHDARAFAHRAECVAGVYSTFFESAGPVNPRLTLEQDVADVGGVALAYDALFKGSTGMDWAKLKGGLGGVKTRIGQKQLFFVSWGQLWCAKIRRSTERYRLLADPHAPDAFRASAPLTQIPDFAKAFSCPPHSPMHPVQKCPVVW
mmetsp:Transcript_37804/g.88369  ORF Transcript_37804/g.88369 Transcript_37804/m.88369 type:complete len:354 (-) Transcript_37804:6-1067(-)